MTHRLVWGSWGWFVGAVILSSVPSLLVFVNQHSWAFPWAIYLGFVVWSTARFIFSQLDKDTRPTSLSSGPSQRDGIGGGRLTAFQAYTGDQLSSLARAQLFGGYKKIPVHFKGLFINLSIQILFSSSHFQRQNASPWLKPQLGSYLP